MKGVRGFGDPRPVTLPSASARWYDVTITTPSHADCLRRMAGHMETGAAGVSDPGILTY